jgi:hypothetical protein
MAEIHCPFCGYPNSSEAEVCGICGARLKPLNSSARSSGSTSEDPSSPGSVPVPGDGSDWLNNLRGDSEGLIPWSDAETEPEKDTRAEPAEVPDWLARIRQRNEKEEPGQSQEEDWLQKFSQNEPSPKEALPDWFNGEQNASNEAVQREPENVPDWLASLQQESSEEKPPEPEGNWLDKLRSAEVEPENNTAKPPENQTGFPESESEEDWVAKLSNWNSPYPEEPGESAIPPAVFEEKPTRGLNKFLHSKAEPAMDENVAPEPLDWLNSTENPAPVSAEPEDASDWLSKLPPAQIDAAYQSDLSDWSNPVPQSNAAPDSSEFPANEMPEVPAGIASAAPDATLPASGTETPDWLTAFGSDLPVEEIPKANESAPEPGGILPFAGNDLSNWLGENDVFEENQTEAEAPAGTGNENITPAQLPGWLEAMRPIEAVFLPHENAAALDGETTVEKSGPLAGLVGALPGEDLVIKIRKPPTYSSRLQVNERQRLHASMIEEMLSDEATPQPTRPGRSHIPQHIVRLVIALVLTLALLLPMLTGARQMVLPSLFPPETVSFYNILQALPENSTVLVAVDYEPGLSGELQLAAAPVLDHLAEHKAQLVLMSTTPTGPVLAANLLQASKLGSSLQVTHLGYLAGGTVGLQELARYPQMALPYTTDSQPAWTKAPLSGINSLSKFAVVVVLTDNAETARAWFEQVKPALGSVPLLFVSSAQVAPLLQPYLDSGQCQGVVSGLAGGIMYSQFAKQAGPGSIYWDSYQYGIFVAILLILVGGLLQLFSSFLKRRPARKKA